MATRVPALAARRLAATAGPSGMASTRSAGGCPQLATRGPAVLGLALGVAGVHHLACWWHQPQAADSTEGSGGIWRPMLQLRPPALCEEDGCPSLDDGLAAGGGCMVAPQDGSLLVGGFKFDDSKLLNNVHELRARGCTYCTHWGLEVCAAVLYLPEHTRAATGEDVMDPKVAKQLELRYLRRITGDQFRLSTRWSISRNGLLGEDAKRGLEDFNPLYRDVARGDCYTLCYDPGSEASGRIGRVTLRLNGRELGSVQGAEFSRALFSVWFGPRPFLDKFKSDLLQGPWP